MLMLMVAMIIMVCFFQLERTVLNKSEENRLVEWLTESARRNFGKTKVQVMDTTKCYRRRWRKAYYLQGQQTWGEVVSKFHEKAPQRAVHQNPASS